MIEEDQEKLAMEEKLKQLEKSLNSLRLEVEASSQQNEKVKIQKEERPSKELNSRMVLAERKQNEELREKLRETEEKRQNQRDQERDYNRDVY